MIYIRSLKLLLRKNKNFNEILIHYYNKELNIKHYILELININDKIILYHILQIERKIIIEHKIQKKYKNICFFPLKHRQNKLE